MTSFNKENVQNDQRYEEISTFLFLLDAAVFFKIKNQSLKLTPVTGWL